MLIQALVRSVVIEVAHVAVKRSSGRVVRGRPAAGGVCIHAPVHSVGEKDSNVVVSVRNDHNTVTRHDTTAGAVGSQKRG